MLFPNHHKKKNLTLYKDSALKQKSGSMAKKSYVSVPKLYQNPKKYHQIHYTRVKPYGQVGYTVSQGFEGIKTYLIMKRLGTYNGYNYYNNATWYAVRCFQASHHLKVTDNVDQKTRTKLGLGKKLFKQIDSYTAPLGAQAWESRKAHIEAMIRQAYKYTGHPYLVGSSSMTRYGSDCSGLVIQSLYAGGISPVPVSAIGHQVVTWVSWIDNFPNHALLLTGYNKSRIYYNDPWTGKKSSMTSSNFWNHYARLTWLGGNHRALSY